MWEIDYDYIIPWLDEQDDDTAACIFRGLEGLMASLNDYVSGRGISESQMDLARERTQAVIDAYSLKEARKAAKMTQVQMAQLMGVSQNRVSRMESGEVGSMSLDSIRRYVEALGGSVQLVATLPTGTVSIV